MERRSPAGGQAMKVVAWMLLVAGSIHWSGCKERPRGETTVPARKPVVAMAPVPTKPFEEGYNAGYEFGKKQATPRANIPEPEDVKRLAQEQSAGHPERTERWERGFVEGYTDG